MAAAIPFVTPWKLSGLDTSLNHDSRGVPPFGRGGLTHPEVVLLAFRASVTIERRKTTFFVVERLIG